MKFELSEFIEQPDGSAVAQLECDDECKKYLINLGLIAIIEKAISDNKLKDMRNEKTNYCGSPSVDL